MTRRSRRFSVPAPRLRSLRAFAVQDDWTAREDQLRTLAQLIANPRWLDRSDPGTGKTLPACLYTWWNWIRRGKKTVWVQPLSLIKKNRDELLRFTEFRPGDISIFSEPPPVLRLLRVLELAKAAGLRREGTRFFSGKQAVNAGVVNELLERKLLTPELSLSEGGHRLFDSGALHAQLALDAKVLLMSADAFGEHAPWLLHYNPDIDLLVGDEWHMMYSTNDSQRTQALYRAMKKISRLLAMTGTIIRGRLSSAYPLIHLIEPRYYGSHDTFINYHAVLDDWGKVQDWINHEKLSKILEKHSTRLLFKDVYGEAPMVLLTEYVDPSEEQLAAYAEFEEKASLELENTVLDGTLPGVHLIRARQILSSPELFGIGKGKPTGRDERLLVHLQEHLETGEPLLIYSASRPEQERTLEMVTRLGMPARLMNGTTSMAERGRIDEAFRAGDIQVLIASEQVAAVGFNWSHVDHVVYLTFDYFDDNFDQSWKRTTRGVRTKPVRLTPIVYANTVEEACLGILERKMRLANAIDPTKKAVFLHQARDRPEKEEVRPLFKQETRL